MSADLLEEDLAAEGPGPGAMEEDMEAEDTRKNWNF